MATKVSEEDADQLYGEIDNQGFGYWIQNYGSSSMQAYPDLAKLANEACNAMDRLEQAMIAAGVPLDE